MSQEFIVEQTSQGAIVAHVTGSGIFYDAHDATGLYMGYTGTREGARDFIAASGCKEVNSSQGRNAVESAAALD